MPVQTLEAMGGSIPVWLVTPPFDVSAGPKALSVWDIDRDLAIGCIFRGVSVDRLSIILRTGIDVEPPNRHFFADHFEKAMEYGDWPKVILALDVKKVKRTFVEIPADTPQAEIASLRAIYPTLRTRNDGEALWLSRLPDQDPRVASPYEVAHGYWIPDDPRSALRGIVILASSKDEPALRALCSSPES